MWAAGYPLETDLCSVVLCDTLTFSGTCSYCGAALCAVTLTLLHLLLLNISTDWRRNVLSYAFVSWVFPVLPWLMDLLK